jgi:hypothetical protein
MDFDPSRLRRGELIVGACAVLLLVFMLAFAWYGVSGRLAPTLSTLGVSTSSTGWESLTHVRWLVLLTVVVSLALVFVQATRRAPAVPVAVSVIATTLGLLTTLALLYRVVINVPGANDAIEQKPGAFLALASAIGLTYGGYLSLRREGLPDGDARQEIPTVRLGSEGGS